MMISDCWISTDLPGLWTGYRSNIFSASSYVFSLTLLISALLRIFLCFSLYSYRLRILWNTIFLLKVRATCGAESRTFELKTRSTVSRGQIQVWYVVRCIVLNQLGHWYISISSPSSHLFSTFIGYRVIFSLISLKTSCIRKLWK